MSCLGILSAFRRFLLLFLSVALIPCFVGQAQESVKVAVASNFLGTLQKLKPVFEQQHDITLLISAGSTGKLYAQILHGAPYDVFLAADAKRPVLLLENDKFSNSQRFTYALGQLAIVHPGYTQQQFEAELLQSDKIRRVALANPKLAPYGVAAKSWLIQQGLWEKTAHKRVLGENVGQAMQFVLSGNAQVGFVALSMAKSFPELTYTLLPSGSYPEIIQQGVLLRSTDASTRFVSFLQSDQAKDILEKNGYRMP